jgi:hypothetical protein
MWLISFHAPKKAQKQRFHGGCAHFLQCAVHDGPGVAKKYIHLRLLVLLVARVLIAPVIACVIVACVVDNITHLLFLGSSLLSYIAAAGGAAEAEAENHSSCVM